MKFLVVVPTVRQSLPGFDEIMARLQSTFSHPTDFHILDGKPNKPETLNRAYDELLVPSDCDFYVTIDDDYLAAPGWQDTVAAAASVFPQVGAFGIWLGDSPEMLEVMGARMIGPEEEQGGVRFRRLRGNHHIAGALIAFRREAALAVGKQPKSELNYQIWEDAWRNRSVRKAGWDLLYLVNAETPGLHEYVDPPEYLQRKEEDVRLGRKMADRIFLETGVADPLPVRIRRALGGLKARLLRRR